MLGGVGFHCAATAIQVDRMGKFRTIRSSKKKASNALNPHGFWYRLPSGKPPQTQTQAQREPAGVECQCCWLCKTCMYCDFGWNRTHRGIRSMRLTNLPTKMNEFLSNPRISFIYFIWNVVKKWMAGAWVCVKFMVFYLISFLESNRMLCWSIFVRKRYT